MTRSTVRLFVEAPLTAGGAVELDGPRAHYLLTVMRLKAGDGARLFNGRDGEWLARIEGADRAACTLTLEGQTRQQDAGPDLWLVPSPLKRGPFEMMVEKATELGVSAIHPVRCAYTQPSRLNLDRLNAIAVEAAEQSDRLSVPEITEVRPLAQVLSDWPSERRLLFCDESGVAPPLAEVLTGRTDAAGKVLSDVGQLVDDVLGGVLGGGAPMATSRAWAILTGPVGGFAPEERDLLRAHDCVIPASLGPRVLRAETAAIAALSLWQALLGDWRG